MDGVGCSWHLPMKDIRLRIHVGRNREWLEASGNGTVAHVVGLCERGRTETRLPSPPIEFLLRRYRGPGIGALVRASTLCERPKTETVAMKRNEMVDKHS